MQFSVCHQNLRPSVHSSCSAKFAPILFRSCDAEPIHSSLQNEDSTASMAADAAAALDRFSTIPSSPSLQHVESLH